MVFLPDQSSEQPLTNTSFRAIGKGERFTSHLLEVLEAFRRKPENVRIFGSEDAQNPPVTRHLLEFYLSGRIPLMRGLGEVTEERVQQYLSAQGISDLPNHPSQFSHLPVLDACSRSSDRNLPCEVGTILDRKNIETVVYAVGIHRDSRETTAQEGKAGYKTQLSLVFGHQIACDANTFYILSVKARSLSQIVGYRGYGGVIPFQLSVQHK